MSKMLIKQVRPKSSGYRHLCTILVILLVGAFIMSMYSIVYADDYDDLISKWVIKLTGYDAGDPYNTNDTYIKQSLDKLDEDAEHYWSTMNKTTYTWDDVKDSSATNEADINVIYGRLRVMAEAWATYGSTYYNNSSILSDTKQGLDWVYNNRYNEDTTYYGNWWWWEIGIPITLNNTVVLLYDELTSTQRTNYMDAVDYFSPTVYTSSITSGSMIGANRVWKCKVVGIRATIVKNSTKLQEASDGLDDVFAYVTSGEGFYADGSFIAHSKFPYGGGYGRSLLFDITELLWFLDGSTWDNTSTDKGNVFEWFCDTFEPAMLKGQIFESIRGREIARPPSVPSVGSHTIYALLMQVENSSNPNITTHKKIIKYHIQNGNQDLYYRTTRWNIVKSENIMDDAAITPAAELIVNYQFYNQDRVVHRRSGWVFDLAMHSDRIKNYEVIQNENVKSWYTADGMTYLYLNPADYCFNYWSTIDPHRLPGITVDRCTSRPDATTDGGYMNSKWVGGVKLEDAYGTAGMDFKQHGYTGMDLSAKKSWFMFDEEVVALGANIKSTSDRTIETIVDNRALNSEGNNALKVNGTSKSTALGWSETMSGTNWVHLDGTGGYVFLSPVTLKGLREQRTGEWYDINKTFYYNAAHEEFNSTTKQSCWEWVREDDSKYSFTGTALNITTQLGTMEGSTNTTKNLLLAYTPPQDFYATTRLTFSPTANGQEAGIIIYLDDSNFVYVSRGYTGGSNYFIAASESSGSYTKNTVSDALGSTIYLKVQKKGNEYSMYKSSNGTDWGTAIYTYTNTLAGTDSCNTDLKIGLFAQNGTNGSAPQITASFDYFHLKEVKNYMTLWFDHGVDPTDDSYSYVILPNKTYTEVSNYSSNPEVEIIENNSRIQAVKEKDLGITCANFWEKGHADYITSYNPAAIMVKKQSNQLTVAVSDPTHNQTKIKVELHKSGLSMLSKDSTVTVLQLSPTIIFEVDVSQEKGKSHNVKFSYDPLAPSLPPPIFIDLNPEADSYVRDGTYANTNYGSSTGLEVKKSDASYNRQTFLKFDLSSICGEIDTAKLYVYGDVAAGTGDEIDCKIYGVNDDSWTENSITWNNKPTTGSYLSTVHFTDPRLWREIDITSYVKTQYDGDKKVSLTILQDVYPGKYVGIDSKEAANKPYLQVTTYPGELLQAEADSYVRDGTYANTNYGSSTGLEVKKSDTGYNRQSFLKFDLSSISGEIDTATLYVSGMVCADPGDEIDCKAYEVNDDSWTESGITWNNKPTTGSYLGTAHFTDSQKWKEIDVTSYVTTQYNGDKKVSLTILQDVYPGKYVGIDSKEATYKPRLKVVVKPTIKIGAEADSYVRDGTYANTNYGSSTGLEVKKSDTSYNRQTFLKFDLNLINEEIDSVKLYVYGDVADGGGTEVDCKAYGVNDDSWTESGITWNNKPATGSYLSTVGFTDPRLWREFDVTSYVKTQNDGDKKVSLTILQDSYPGLYVGIDSKEYTNKPYLKVYYKEY